MVLCLIDCLRRTGMRGESLRQLEAHGMDVEALFKCLDQKCRTSDEVAKRSER